MVAQLVFAAHVPLRFKVSDSLRDLVVDPYRILRLSRSLCVYPGYLFLRCPSRWARDDDARVIAPMIEPGHLLPCNESPALMDLEEILGPIRRAAMCECALVGRVVTIVRGQWSDLIGECVEVRGGRARVEMWAFGRTVEAVVPVCALWPAALAAEAV